MPPPMTLETMMAAASSGPRRRSSAEEAATTASVDGVHLDAFDRFVGDVVQLERDARDQLVLAVLDAGVVPTGADVSDLENFLDVELMAAAREEECGGQCNNNAPHNVIVMPRTQRV